MLIKWRKTALFGSLLDHTRGLLLLTMPSAHLRNPEIALDHSLGSQAQSLSSYVTASSGFFPGLLVPRGAAGERRNRRGAKKKTAHMAESISDEEKSQEYKAFEAFTAAHFSEHALTSNSPYLRFLCRFAIRPASAGHLRYHGTGGPSPVTRSHCNTTRHSGTQGG